MSTRGSNNGWVTRGLKWGLITRGAYYRFAPRGLVRVSLVEVFRGYVPIEEPAKVPFVIEHRIHKITSLHLRCRDNTALLWQYKD